VTPVVTSSRFAGAKHLVLRLAAARWSNHPATHVQVLVQSRSAVVCWHDCSRDITVAVTPDAAKWLTSRSAVAKLLASPLADWKLLAPRPAAAKLWIPAAIVPAAAIASKACSLACSRRTAAATAVASRPAAAKWLASPFAVAKLLASPPADASPAAAADCKPSASRADQEIRNKARVADVRRPIRLRSQRKS
jgi:hypothetical protein